MKKITAFLLITVIIFSMTACGNKYFDDLPAKDLSDALERGIVTDGGYREADSDFLTFHIDGGNKYIKDFRIILAVNSGENASEIGVFRANNEADAKSLAKLCQSYINNKKAHWNYDYNPDENVKIENADVKIFGVYVVYTVLTPEDTEYVSVIIENLIGHK